MNHTLHIEEASPGRFLNFSGISFSCKNGVVRFSPSLNSLAAKSSIHCEYKQKIKFKNT